MTPLFKKENLRDELRIVVIIHL